jgi:hypothetical protein
VNGKYLEGSGLGFFCNPFGEKDRDHINSRKIDTIGF